MTPTSPDLAAIFSERWRARLPLRAGSSVPSLDASGDLARLDVELGKALAHAREVFPDVMLSPDRFVAHLADKVSLQPDLDEMLSSLSQLRHPDLYLAAACADGDPEALAVFERRYAAELLAGVPRQADRARLSSEARQIVRMRLLVGESGDGPKIRDYAGRGELSGFVRMVAVRTALNLLRSEKRRSQMNDAAGNVPVPIVDADLARIQALHRDDFRIALQNAAAALSVRQRNLLRQHHIDGLTMDQLAHLYGLHRVTVIRALQSARNELAHGVRRQLKNRLRIGEQELDSLLRIIDSQLELSIRRYLA